MAYSSSITSNRKDNESIRSHMSARSQKILEKTKDEIDNLNEDLERLSNENMKLRKEEKELADQLDAITQALNQNLQSLAEVNEQIEMENEEMREEIRKRNEQMDIVQPLIDQCLAMNPQIFQNNQNLEALLNQIKQSQYSQGYELALDPLLNKILPGIDYFKDIKTNSDFLQRCRLLMNEIRRLEKKRNEVGGCYEEEFNKSNVIVLRKQLSTLQSINNGIQIDYSERIKDLAQEKQQLLEEKRKLIDSRIKSKADIPPTPTRRSSMTMHKSGVSASQLTPIMKKRQISSPLKFD